MRHEISGAARRIFLKLLRFVEKWKRLITAKAVLRSLKGRCHGNQFYRQNRRFWSTCLICHTGVPTQIGISERRWADEKPIECGYIVYTFGDVWWSNSEDIFANFYNYLKMAKISISGWLSQSIYTDLNHIFSFNKHVGSDD